MPSAATIDAVADTLARINAAWREGRPHDMASLLDEDVVMVFPGFAGRINGRQALVDSFVTFGREAVVRTFEQDTLHVDGGDHAAIAQYRFEMVYDREGASWRSTGWDAWVFERRGDAWVAVWRTMQGVAEERAGSTDGAG